MPVPGLGNVEDVATEEKRGCCPTTMQVHVKKKKKSKCFQVNVWCVYCKVVNRLSTPVSMFHNVNNYMHMTEPVGFIIQL